MAEDTVNSLSNDASGNEGSALDKRIVLALEAAPWPGISAGFAARVLAQLPARPDVRLTPARYGYRVGAGCVVVLLALMLAVAHPASGKSAFALSLEWTFYAQVAVLAVWLVARSAGYTLTSIF